MTMFRFYGASDDLVEIEVTGHGHPPYDDEQCVKDDGVLAFELQGPTGERMGVVVGYGKSGATWFAAPCMADEGVPLPDWTFWLMRANEERCGYSMMLEIDAPDGTTLTSEVESERKSWERTRVWPPEDK